MVGEFAVVAQGYVLLLPVFVEGFVRTLVQIALLDGNSTADAQLADGRCAIFALFFVLFLVLVFLLGRRSKQIGPPPRFPAPPEKQKEQI